MKAYDVAVIGAGPAGICAALAAARQGAETLLVTDRPVLGGNSSSEVRVWTRGATGGGNLFAEEMGIWGELKLTALSRDTGGSVFTWDDVLLDAALETPRLSMLLNTLVTSIDLGDEKITALHLRGIRTELDDTVAAKMVVDCTGDGFIAKAAGVPFRSGREDKQAFGESLALSKADNHTQGCSILLQSKRTGRLCPYTPPNYAYSMEKVQQLVNRGGRIVYADMQGSDCWWFEYGGQLDVIADDQPIELELRAIVLGIWNYIKNSGQYEADDLQLEWMGYYPGRRCSRRLVGADLLVQADVTDDLRRDNAIAYGGWYMDSHPSGGLLSDKEQCKQLPVHCYGIPFGCLHNQSVQNLLFAGRCASMSYVAFTSARIMNTCALMGQAAGTAAALCAAGDVMPASLPLETLRHRLALNDALLCQPVKLNTADEIIASSRKRPEAKETADRLPLVQEAFVVLPAAPQQEVLLWVDCDADAELQYFSEESPLPSRRADMGGEAKRGVLRLAQGRQMLRFRCEKTGFLQVRFDPSPAVSLIGGTALPGVLAGYREEADLFHPLAALGGDHYAPQNVQDGYLRPWNGVRAWASDGLRPQGESLALRWNTAIPLRAVLLFFDPELSQELTSSRCAIWEKHHHYAARTGMPETLVRDYQLIAITPDGERLLADVHGNTQRRRLHHFPSVEARELQIRIFATYGGDAVVYAVIPNPEYDRYEGGVE